MAMSSRPFAIAMLALAALTAGCATSRTVTPTEEYSLTGFVHAGPVCPVEKDPPDPECADRPVAGALLLVVDADGEGVGEVRTDVEGLFELRLPAGVYTLVPQPVDGLLGTASPIDFSVGGLQPDLDVAYDTGIR